MRSVATGEAGAACETMTRVRARRATLDPVTGGGCKRSESDSRDGLEANTLSTVSRSDPRIATHLQDIPENVIRDVGDGRRRPARRAAVAAAQVRVRALGGARRDGRRLALAQQQGILRLKRVRRIAHEAVGRRPADRASVASIGARSRPATDARHRRHLACAPCRRCGGCDVGVARRRNCAGSAVIEASCASERSRNLHLPRDNDSHRQECNAYAPHDCGDDLSTCERGRGVDQRRLCLPQPSSSPSLNAPVKRRPCEPSAPPP